MIRFDPNKGRPHEATLPVPEASDVERCANLDFAQQREEVDRLRRELEAIAKDRDAVLGDEEDREAPSPSSSDHLEPFRQKTAEFLRGADAGLAELSELVEESGRKFGRAVRFYQFRPAAGSSGEDPKEFFSVWHPFCRDFKDLWKREQVKKKTEICTPTLISRKKKIN